MSPAARMGKMVFQTNGKIEGKEQGKRKCPGSVGVRDGAPILW